MGQVIDLKTKTKIETDPSSAILDCIAAVLDDEKPSELDHICILVGRTDKDGEYLVARWTNSMKLADINYLLDCAKNRLLDR